MYARVEYRCMGRTSITLNDWEKEWVNENYGSVSSFVSRKIREENKREQYIDLEERIPNLPYSNLKEAPRGSNPMDTGEIWINNERNPNERPISVNASIEISVDFYIPPDATKAELHESVKQQAYSTISDILDVRYHKFDVNNPFAGQECGGEDCEHVFHSEEFPRSTITEQTKFGTKRLPLCEDCHNKN